VSEQDERTLADLRRDIAEAHAITTRTHNALTTLAATLKDIVERQARYERGLNLNSFVAYLLFTVLLGGGFYMLYRSRAENLLGDREVALRARAEAIAETERARQELEARELASRKAEELWQLLGEGKRAEFIARLPEIVAFKMSPVERQVLEQGAARAKAEIVDASFAAGVDAIRGQQWKRAAAELQKAMAFESEGPRALQMSYYLGLALVKQGDAEAALPHLERAVAGGVEKNVAPDARYYLAQALDMAQQSERARAEYLKFADNHWNHPWAPRARRLALQILQRSRAQ
jgi:tetratricopeptide (TPR) repeat protein